MSPAVCLTLKLFGNACLAAATTFFGAGVGAYATNEIQSHALIIFVALAVVSGLIGVVVRVGAVAMGCKP